MRPYDITIIAYVLVSLYVLARMAHGHRVQGFLVASSLFTPLGYMASHAAPTATSSAGDWLITILALGAPTLIAIVLMVRGIDRATPHIEAAADRCLDAIETMKARLAR